MRRAVASLMMVLAFAAMVLAALSSIYTIIIVTTTGVEAFTDVSTVLRATFVMTSVIGLIAGAIGVVACGATLRDRGSLRPALLAVGIAWCSLGLWWTLMTAG